MGQKKEKKGRAPDRGVPKTVMCLFPSTALPGGQSGKAKELPHHPGLSEGQGKWRERGKRTKQKKKKKEGEHPTVVRRRHAPIGAKRISVQVRRAETKVRPQRARSRPGQAAGQRRRHTTRPFRGKKGMEESREDGKATRRADTARPP